MKISYRLKQLSKGGKIWVSCVHEAETLRDMRRCVVAGFLYGEARWAETLEGEPLYGMTSSGSEMVIQADWRSKS